MIVLQILAIIVAIVIGYYTVVYGLGFLIKCLAGIVALGSGLLGFVIAVILLIINLIF